MDATATPRGISLAVGELGARGRPINKQCTAVRISSTVNGDMCGTCQADLLSLSALARDARNPRLLFRLQCLQSSRTSLLQRMQRQHHVRGRADWRTCMPSHAPHSPPAWIDQLTAPASTSSHHRVSCHEA